MSEKRFCDSCGKELKEAWVKVEIREEIYGELISAELDYKEYRLCLHCYFLAGYKNNYPIIGIKKYLKELFKK
jgi:hypothetical protein